MFHRGDPASAGLPDARCTARPRPAILHRREARTPCGHAARPAAVSGPRKPADRPVRRFDRMIPASPPSDPPIDAVPARWRAAAAPALLPGERPLAAAETDLDPALRFADGLLLVTDRRLLAWPALDAAPAAWPLAPALTLTLQDHAGVATLALADPQRRLAAWRATMAQASPFGRLVETFRTVASSSVPDAADVADVADAREVETATGGVERNDVERDGIDRGDVHRGPVRHRDAAAAGASHEHRGGEAGRDDQDREDRGDDPEDGTASTWVLLRLWRFARPYRRRLLIGLLLTVAATAATLVPPYLTLPLMDDVLIPYQNGVAIEPRTVLLYLGGLLASALLAWVLGWARTWQLALVSERIGADLRTATYDHLMSLPLEYFGAKRTGDLMARIGSETDRLNLFLSLHLLDFATDLLVIAMTAVILFSINPWLALATLLPLPLIVWLIHLVRDRLRHGFEKVDRIWAEVTNVLADTIPGIRVVKAFAQEARESARFREANRHNLEINDRVNKVWSLFTPTVTLLTEIGLLIVWAFGIWLVANDRITVGVLTAFIAYIGRFYTRLDSMSRIVSVTQKAAAGAKRIFDILDHVSSVPEPAEPARLGRVDGRIGIEGVRFRYGNRPIIRGVDLAIAPGEMIGLVGHSGSGKSTLVNLILRFHDVAEGRITLDGTDIRRFAVADYRRHIGLVLQEPFLFFGTIAENIAYGRPGASRAEIVAAARAAHAHEFILRLPLGYDSLVGERGQALSGGERQRISIARALLIDPKILILDEATSSVDTETEREIQKALDNLVQGRTTIAIAHRLSTLRKADRLVVLDRGMVVEQGRHEQLLERDGHYAKLYRAQQRMNDGDAAAAGEGGG
ncbi:MAG: ABC transporter ATP-binding protein [Lautropia sp.]